MTRTLSQGWVLPALALLVGMSIVGCGQDGSASGPERSFQIDGLEVSAATMLRGSLVYGRLCRRCHGPNGHGDGRHGLALPRRPTNLREGPYPVSTGGAARLPTDEELARTIHVGIEASGMPAHPMDPQDSAAIVQYIKSLNPAWSTAPGG